MEDVGQFPAVVYVMVKLPVPSVPNPEAAKSTSPVAASIIPPLSMVNVPPGVTTLDGNGFASSLQYWFIT